MPMAEVSMMPETCMFWVISPSVSSVAVYPGSLNVSPIVRSIRLTPSRVITGGMVSG